MTNPLLGTLTQKFETLSSDVASYIAGVQNDISIVTNNVAAGNGTLLDILEAITELKAVMQEAADCACQAASTLQDIADNPTTPPPASACEDPDATVGDLQFERLGNNDGYWVTISGTTNWRLDLGYLSPILNSPSGPGGSITLPGPRWYQLYAYYPPTPYNRWTYQLTLGTKTILIAGLAEGGVGAVETFFVAEDTVLLVQVNGGPDTAGEEPEGYISYVRRCVVYQ